jgi:hypothetical protein
MVGLLLDTLVLAGTLRVVLGDDAPDWQHIFFVVLGVVAASWVLALVLGPLALIYILLPASLLVTGVVFAFAFQLTIGQTAIVLGVYFVYQLLFQLVFGLLF